MISVSILSKKDNYVDSIKQINNTNADFLHLDVMDNTFTANSSFNIEEAQKVNELSSKKLDVHIMSKNLDNILEDYISLKPYSISIHYEAVDDISKYIKTIKDNNIKVGLAINPDTFVSEIYEYLSDIDIVLVMGVEPGKGGQEYLDSTTKKLKQLKDMQDNYSYLIEIDGGINDKTINNVKNYADIIVSGSFITKSDDYQGKINELLK